MAGYQTIGGVTKAAGAAVGYGEERTITGGYQSSSAEAVAVAVKAEEAAETPSSGFPSLYTAPFDLSTGTSLGDRLRLIWESARPWGEFFDFTTFSVPKAGDVAERLTHNSEVFFSNYVIAAALYLVFLFFIRPMGVLSLLGSLFLASWFYGTKGTEIVLNGGQFTITTYIKHIIMGVVVLLSIFYFGAFAALTGLFWFCLIFVGIHLLIVTPSRMAI